MKLVIKILLIALIPTILLGEQTKDVMVTYGQSADLIVNRKITKRANNDFMGNKELIQAQTDVSKKILENRLGLIRKSFMGFYGQLAYGCQAVVERVAKLFGYLQQMVRPQEGFEQLQMQKTSSEMDSFKSKSSFLDADSLDKLQADKLDTIKKSILNRTITEEQITHFLAEQPDSGVNLIKYIDESNINDSSIALCVVSAVLKVKPECSVEIIKHIDKSNISNVLIACTVVPEVLKVNPECAVEVIKHIDKSNISNVLIACFVVPGVLKAKPECAAEIIKHIDKSNINTFLIASHILPGVLKAKPECAVEVIKHIDKSNINNFLIALRIIPEVLKAKPECAVEIIKYIDKSNISNLLIGTHILPVVLKAKPECAVGLIKYIDKKNISKLCRNSVKQMLPYDQEKKLKSLVKKIEFNNSSAEVYLFYPKCITNENFASETKKIFFYGSSDSLSEKHFESTEKASQIFYKGLVDDQDRCISLLEMLKNEKIEQNETQRRYQVYHGREGNRFVTDNVFLHLLEIFYGKPINDTAFYAQHYAFPKEKWQQNEENDNFKHFKGMPINYPEEKAEELVKNGVPDQNSFTHERSVIQFASDLFGIKDGSSALSYVLSNSNAGWVNRSAFSIANLFKKLGIVLGKDCMKYYNNYKSLFNKIYEMGTKFKDGTMLQYSFTKGAFKKYVYVTHNGIGLKKSPIVIGKEETFDPVTVQDALREGKIFEDENKTWEYCMVLTDEGIANPFNEEIKTYHFHLKKEDKELAKEIKQKIAYVFNLIRADMVKDGVLKDTSAWDKKAE